MTRKIILTTIVLLSVLIITIGSIVLFGGNADKGTAKQHFDQGQKLAGQGSYDDAIVELSKAIELDPNIAESYRVRGSIYAYQGQYEPSHRRLHQGQRA